MRYAAALLVAACIIAAVGLFVWQTQRQLEAQIRQALRQEQEAGRAPLGAQEADTESAELGGFNLKVPAGQLARVDLSRLLASTWYVWSPLVVVLCLGSAAVIGRIRNRPR